MATDAQVPMFDPQGTVRLIPPDQVSNAPEGWKPAVRMLDPQGAPRWVPKDQQSNAPQGWTVAGDPNTTAPTSQGGGMLSDYLHRYVQFVKGNLGNSPSEYFQKMDQRVRDALQQVPQGAANYNTRTALNIMKAARSVDQWAGLYQSGHPLDKDIAQAEDILSKQESAHLTDQQKEAQDFGGETWGAMQYIAAEAAAGGMKLFDLAQKLPAIEKAVKASPLAAKALSQLALHGTLGAGQAATQGADTSEILKQGGISALLGVLGASPQLAAEKRLALAREVAPTVTNIEGQDFTRLASSARGEEGQVTATPTQTRAAVIGSEPAIAAANQAALKRGFTDVAKRGVAQLAADENAARPVPPTRITDPSRLLPGESQPFTMPTSNAEPQWTRTRRSPAGTNVVEMQTVPNPNYEAPAGTLTREPGQTVEEAARDIGTAATTVPERVITGPEPVDTRNAAQRRLDAARGAPERMVLGPETVTAPVERHVPPAAGTGAGPELAGGGTRVFPNVDAMQTERTRLQAQIADRATPPATVAALKDQLAQLNQQLKPYDDFQAAHPHFMPADVRGMMDSTESFGDAARHADTMARGKLEMLNPKQRESFSNYDAKLQDLQQQFDNAVTPEEKGSVMRQMQAVNDVAEQIFKGPEMSTRISAPEAAQAVKQLRLRNGFQALQNVVDKHMTFTPEEAALGNTGRYIRNKESFIKDLSEVRAKYGDVLDPLLGQDGIDNLIRMGHMADDPTVKAAAKTYAQNIGATLKRHFTREQGVAALFGAGSLQALGHLALGVKGAAAGVGIEAYHRMIMNRLATDPAFNRQFMYAVQRGVGSRVSAYPLAAFFTQWTRNRRQQQPQEPTNAPSR